MLEPRPTDSLALIPACPADEQTHLLLPGLDRVAAVSVTLKKSAVRTQFAHVRVCSLPPEFQLLRAVNKRDQARPASYNRAELQQNEAGIDPGVNPQDQLVVDVRRLRCSISHHPSVVLGALAPAAASKTLFAIVHLCSLVSRFQCRAVHPNAEFRAGMGGHALIAKTHRGHLHVLLIWSPLFGLVHVSSAVNKREQPRPATNNRTAKSARRDREGSKRPFCVLFGAQVPASLVFVKCALKGLHTGGLCNQRHQTIWLAPGANPVARMLAKHEFVIGKSLSLGRFHAVLNVASGPGRIYDRSGGMAEGSDSERPE